MISFNRKNIVSRTTRLQDDLDALLDGVAELVLPSSEPASELSGGGGQLVLTTFAASNGSTG